MNALAKIDPTQKNILLPTQTLQQISPWHAVRTSEVKIDPNPDNGEVFKVGSKQDKNGNWEDTLYIAKPGCFKIAQAAGIVWNWNACGPIGNPTRDYVIYKAVGAMRLPDGSWQPITAHKEIDIPTIEEEVRVQYVKKANGALNGEKDTYKGEWKKYKITNKNGEEYEKNGYFLREDEKARYITDKTHSDIIQWRKNKLGRAESGAMLRVIRAALGMKSSYTRAELEKPFVVPRIDFTPNYNDPSVRQALIDHGVASMASLFGQSSYAAPPNLGGHTAFERPQIEAPISDHPVHVEGVMMDDEEDPAPSNNVGHKEKSESAATAKTEPAKTEEASTSQSTSTTTTNNGKTEYIYHCTKCGKGIKENVHNYCKDNFNGVDLCFSCQNKEVAA